MEVTLSDITRLMLDYWPGSSRHTPAILQEHFQQCQDMNVTLIEFEAAIKKYRESSTAHFMPIARDFKSYLYRNASSSDTSRERKIFDFFVNMVTNIGWYPALRAVYADFPRVAEVLQARGITEGSTEYDGLSEFMQQFLSLLHYTKDPGMAYQWAAENATDSYAKGFYKGKARFFGQASPEQCAKYFPVLRNKDNEE